MRRIRDFFVSRLAPFSEASFRRFFFVQAISQTGTWSHDLARAWIVLELMGRAGALGALFLASALPSSLLILHGGVLVDRLDVRRIMMWTKSFLALVALGIAATTEFGQIQMWHLIVFAIIEGTTNAFDSPAYQALTVRLVPRQQFQQALALNSTNFHGSRMLGPLVAGVLMAWHGPSLVFLFDGLSYLLVVAILGRLSLREVQRPMPTVKGQTWRALTDGLHYIFSDPSLRYKLLQLITTIALIFPLLLAVFRTYIQKKFSLDADGFGYVFSVPALGAMLGALGFTVLKPARPMRVLIWGIPGLGVGILLTTLAPTATLTTLAMGIAGFFAYLNFATLTVSLHLEIEEEYRGRLGALIGLCFLSLGPLLSFPVGVFADEIGYVEAIYILTGLFLLLSALLGALSFSWYGRKRQAPRPDRS